MASNNQKIIISLGGSLIVPDDIDTGFLRSFVSLISERVKTGSQFAIITGGGRVCRRYQSAARELGVVEPEKLDWVGIHVTKLNAHFLRILFGDLAHPEIGDDPEILGEVARPVLIGAGFHPGHSTDFGAVQIAEKLGARKIVNLSNIDYVYDNDPRQFPDARKIVRVSWREFRKILPEEWGPGLNSPFDGVAAEKAEKLHLEVAIMNGRNLANFENYLDGKAFIGSVIHP